MTWCLATSGLGGQIAHVDSFHNDCHPDIKADLVEYTVTLPVQLASST